MQNEALARNSVRARVADGATIVFSILAAFAIDAWWDTRSEAREIASHAQAVTAEMTLNLERLQLDLERLQRARAAQREILRHTGPGFATLSADSLAMLVGASFDANPAVLDTGALESLIASGHFASLPDHSVRAALTTWRSRYTALQSQGEAFRDSRIRTIEAVGAEVPLLNAARRIDPELVPSSFVFDASRALSDPRFEALFSNLTALSVRLVAPTESLADLTSELVRLLGAIS